MIEQWHDRQAAAHARIEAIKAEQAGKIVDGEAFDVEDLIEAEAELALLYSAEGEDFRRREAGASAANEHRRATVRAQIETLITEREGAIEAAEMACSILCDALQTLFARNDDITKAMRSIGLSPPARIGPYDGKALVSSRIARGFFKAVGSGHFGAITLRSMGGNPMPDGSNPDDSWLTVDRKQNNFKLAMKERRS